MVPVYDSSSYLTVAVKVVSYPITLESFHHHPLRTHSQSMILLHYLDDTVTTGVPLHTQLRSPDSLLKVEQQQPSATEKHS